jgi:hypothetical protein
MSANNNTYRVHLSRKIMEFFSASQTQSNQVTIPYLKHTEIRLFSKNGEGVNNNVKLQRVEFAIGHHVIIELTLYKDLITPENIMASLAELHLYDERIQTQNEYNARFLHECTLTI